MSNQQNPHDTNFIGGDEPDTFIYSKILEIYPFLTPEEEQLFVEKASTVHESSALENILAYLTLLNNPHARIENGLHVDIPDYPTPYKPPKSLGYRLPYARRVKDVLYINIPSLSKSLGEIPRILKEIMDENADLAKGYVIDLRRNSGGSDSNVRDFGERFFSAGEICFGRHVEKTPEGKLTEYEVTRLSRNEYPIEAPIVIITSRTCFSSCERFIAMMKQNPNVIVIGSETGGGSAGPIRFICTIGEKEYTIAIPRWRFFLPDEVRPIEETKIQPDIPYDPMDANIVTFAVSYLAKKRN